MRAITVLPRRVDSARIEEVPEPEPNEGALLVRTLAMGVCGTDREILQGSYGAAPPGDERLIIGHESLGEVLQAPPGAGFAAGDLIAGIVRRPDPTPCASCAAGEWDMCLNGRYTERGIKGLHGFGSSVFRIEPEFAVRVDASLAMAGVLLEPASVLAKAWEQIDRIGARAAAWEPRSVLVTGAGPVGMLAAMMGIQRGLEVHVFDRALEGIKPRLVRDLGATYHGGSMDRLSVRPDIVIECTGASAVVLDVIQRTGALGVVCLTGIPGGDESAAIDLGLVSRKIVLENDAVFGTVNANRRHYEAAARSLAAADRAWLTRLITRRVPLDRWQEALRKEPGDVKVVIDFSS
jgi:glucose 1-dehydrogenase